MYLWHQLLAQKGYIIWILDNRTPAARARNLSGRSTKTWRTGTARSGDGIAWLKTQPYVAGDRMGIWAGALADT